MISKAIYVGLGNMNVILVALYNIVWGETFGCMEMDNKPTFTRKVGHNNSHHASVKISSYKRHHMFSTDANDWSKQSK